MAYLGAVIILVVGMLLYRRHFVSTVSEPIQVMERGLSEHGHNLEVRIPERYRSDDVFRLATLYNSVYLPLKDRRGSEDDAGLADLSVPDLDDIDDMDNLSGEGESE